MKYLKTSEIYKNSTGTLTYNTDTEMAHSYNWYVLAKRFNGVMYINTYAYSNTTCKHIRQLEALFMELGIDYKTIEAPKGLQSLDESLQLYKHRAINIQNLINKPKTRKAKNLERMSDLVSIMAKISEVTYLKGGA